MMSLHYIFIVSYVINNRISPYIFGVIVTPQVWIRLGIQVSRREIYTYIHLNYGIVEFLFFIKK